jgi:CTP synthase (UTP-ammonia lyase)
MTTTPGIGLTRIGLIGDFDATITAHQAIPVALRLAADALALPVEFAWIATDEILDSTCVAGFDGLWRVPGSPYRNMDGALRAIQCARTSPFASTSGVLR